MAGTVQDVMTPDPVTIPTTAVAWDAARLMKEQDIGDVIVTDDGRVEGIVTDRDIVTRVMGEVSIRVAHWSATSAAGSSSRWLQRTRPSTRSS
jgi:CBS domain-containing protein